MAFARALGSDSTDPLHSDQQQLTWERPTNTQRSSWTTWKRKGPLVGYLAPSYPRCSHTMLAKIDIESAFRLVPVHPQDRPLLGVRWDDQLFIDPMLPFGLRSAPKIFNAVADALHWYLGNRGVPHIFHYLDDFIFLGAPHSTQCQDSLLTLNQVCKELGVPIAEHKWDGPATCLLVFLGIEINTVAGILRLPSEKLSRLQTLLRKWDSRKTCSRKDLESLIGHLNHACKVVRAGRSFLRRMIDLLHSRQHASRKPTMIRLNTGFRSDLAWWQTFLTSWNGVSMLPPSSLLPTLEMASNASGNWGCGAWHKDRWFQIPWDDRSQHLPIAVKELIPIIVAGAIWGQAWLGHRVHCHCDNQPVVACLRSRTSKHNTLMHLLRTLVFIEACYNFQFHPLYINTRLADSLSRNDLTSFLSKVPQAHHNPSTVPDELLNLLLDPQADWICQPWRRQFDDIFRKV